MPCRERARSEVVMATLGGEKGKLHRGYNDGNPYR